MSKLPYNPPTSHRNARWNTFPPAVVPTAPVMVPVPVPKPVPVPVDGDAGVGAGGAGPCDGYDTSECRGSLTGVPLTVCEAWKVGGREGGREREREGERDGGMEGGERDRRRRMEG